MRLAALQQRGKGDRYKQFQVSGLHLFGIQVLGICLGFLKEAALCSSEASCSLPQEGFRFMKLYRKDEESSLQPSFRRGAEDWSYARRAAGIQVGLASDRADLFTCKKTDLEQFKSYQGWEHDLQCWPSCASCSGSE